MALPLRVRRGGGLSLSLFSFSLSSSFSTGCWTSSLPCSTGVCSTSISLLWVTKPSLSLSVNVPCEKRCREGENYHMSLPVAFHFGHNHCRSISHNHSDHHRVSLSQSMSTDTIRARYLGPLHFVDHDGWDQTSSIVFLVLAY